VSTGDGVDADGQRRRIVSGAARSLAVQLHERHEPLGLSPDDRERHRKAERARPRHRLGRAAQRDPDGQWLLHRARVDATAVESAGDGCRVT
jgi:hypothetical protein